MSDIYLILYVITYYKWSSSLYYYFQIIFYLTGFLRRFTNEYIYNAFIEEFNYYTKINVWSYEKLLLLLLKTKTSKICDQRIKIVESCYPCCL